MPYSTDTSWFADRPFNPSEITRVVLSRTTKIAPLDILDEYERLEDIVYSYSDICDVAGVNSFLLISQAIHETDWFRSWWSQEPRRNMAGIGVTGQTSIITPTSGAWAQRGDGVWVAGNTFTDWTHAVRAHVGRVLAYALNENQRWHPDIRGMIDYAMSVRPLPASYHGVAPTIGGLNGRWAVGNDYAQRIAVLAQTLDPNY